MVRAGAGGRVLLWKDAIYYQVATCAFFKNDLAGTWTAVLIILSDCVALDSILGLLYLCSKHWLDDTFCFR